MIKAALAGNVSEAVKTAGLSRGADSGNWEPHRNASKFQKTDAVPGSEEKIRILRERLERGLPLWHPHDRQDYETQNTSERERLSRSGQAVWQKMSAEISESTDNAARKEEALAAKVYSDELNSLVLPPQSDRVDLQQRLDRSLAITPEPQLQRNKPSQYLAAQATNRGEFESLALAPVTVPSSRTEGLGDLHSESFDTQTLPEREKITVVSLPVTPTTSEELVILPSKPFRAQRGRPPKRVNGGQLGPTANYTNTTPPVGAKKKSSIPKPTVVNPEATRQSQKNHPTTDHSPTDSEKTVQAPQLTRSQALHLLKDLEWLVAKKTLPASELEKFKQQYGSMLSSRPITFDSNTLSGTPQHDATITSLPSLIG